MDCRQFRKQHAYFMDDMLSGVETWAMRDHLGTCALCSRFDTQLRRSLMIARQAPTLEPSRDFSRKLSARLAAEKLARPAFREMAAPAKSRRLPVMAAAAALVAGLAGFGFFTTTATEPAVVASRISAPVAPMTVPVANKGSVAPATHDQPVHPAILLAQRATEQFIASQARATSIRATH
jgi:hypothetical protein